MTSSDELKEELSKWLLRIDSVENVSKEITALNFGLFEPYGIELIGSKKYDPKDDDWACIEDFVPEERVCPNLFFDEALGWQEVLSMVYTLLKELTNELSELELLDVSYITTGFSDGDLFVLKPSIAEHE